MAVRSTEGSTPPIVFSRAPGHASSPGTIDGPYLRERRPRFELFTETTLDAPIETTFPFFADARNLEAITPADMHFRIVGLAPPMRDGATIDYRLRFGPLPIRWRTVIAAWTPPHRFVDVQTIGPYRCWWHEHTFRADGDRTIMTDRVWYAPPLGLLGAATNGWLIAPSLRRIFAYRHRAIRARFMR